MSKRREQGQPDSEALDAALRDWAAGQERAVSEHPDPEELVDYQEARLEPAAAERLRRHLLACPACREELLLLEGFDREVPEDSPLRPSEQATERGWQRFQAARAAGGAVPAGAATAEEGGRPPRPARSSRPRWLVAASVLLALAAGALLGPLALDRWGREEVVAGGSPFVFDLDPAGSTVLRDAAPLAEILVPPDLDPLVPRLNLGDLTAYESYRVEVFGSEDRLVLQREELARDRTGSVSFLVPRAEWPAGDYGVVLIASEAGRSRELATYRLRLRYAQ